MNWTNNTKLQIAEAFERFPSALEDVKDENVKLLVVDQNNSKDSWLLEDLTLGEVNPVHHHLEIIVKPSKTAVPAPETASVNQRADTSAAAPRRAAVQAGKGDGKVGKGKKSGKLKQALPLESRWLDPRILGKIDFQKNRFTVHESHPCTAFLDIGDYNKQNIQNLLLKLERGTSRRSAITVLQKCVTVDVL